MVGVPQSQPKNHQKCHQKSPKNHIKITNHQKNWTNIFTNRLGDWCIFGDFLVGTGEPPLYCNKITLFMVVVLV